MLMPTIVNYPALLKVDIKGNDVTLVKTYITNIHRLHSKIIHKTCKKSYLVIVSQFTQQVDRSSQDEVS